VSTFEAEPSGAARAKHADGGQQKRRGLARVLAVGALRAASVLYGVGARLHRAVMHRTAARRGRLACAVVSVGGLTVGGAGKTPVAARLALGLHRRGWRVVLASRGYKGRNRLPVSVVSDGSYIHSSVAQSGDESFVLAAHAPGVPVLVGRDRRVVGHHAVSVFDAEIVVLDDGFQHHRLARDIDIVCIDGSGGFGNRWLLPAGPLREPISTLRRADWLCLVDGWAGLDESSDEREAETVSTLERTGTEVVRARRRPVELVSLDRSTRMPLESLRDRSVGLLSGVARPASIHRTLESLGARVVVERRFRDHHEYAPKDCRDLDETDVLWVTTEKDALKIMPEWLGGAALWVLRIEVEIDGENAVLDRLESRLQAAGRLAAHSSGPPGNELADGFSAARVR
jgi:tetraacyldisaccharide 4'-kinase